ncbi:MAG: GntR family transcriptional regulator [Rhodospirillales bacterium]|nr:GntR family transcriptional regulator [Rhodospirillales bacterium]
MKKKPRLRPALFRIDRGSPIPLYIQVRSRLMTIVNSWPDPELMFHTEDELTEAFGVSRVTLRGALSELVEAGYLKRTRGAGTRVTRRKIEERLQLGRKVDKMWANEERMHIALLAFERVAAPPAIAEALGIEAGRDILSIKRLRSTGLSPIAIDWRYVPGPFADRVGREDARTGIYSAIARTVAFDHVRMEIEGGLSGPDEVELLLMPPGTPILTQNFVVYSRIGQAVMLGRSVNRADMTRYSLRMDATSEILG